MDVAHSDNVGPDRWRGFSSRNQLAICAVISFTCEGLPKRTLSHTTRLSPTIARSSIEGSDFSARRAMNGCIWQDNISVSSSQVRGLLFLLQSDAFQQDSCTVHRLAYHDCPSSGRFDSRSEW